MVRRLSASKLMNSSSAAAERDESPLEVAAEVTASPEVITAEVTDSPEVITAEITALPEVITAEVTASPEVITAEVAASPEVITAKVAASTEVTTTPEIIPVVTHKPSSKAFAHEFITEQRKFSIVWVFLVFLDNIIWIIPAILGFIPAIFILIALINLDFA
jgi:hypothetical protein